MKSVSPDQTALLKKQSDQGLYYLPFHNYFHPHNQVAKWTQIIPFRKRMLSKCPIVRVNTLLYLLALVSMTFLSENIFTHDVASGSKITPCNKIDKPLVVYR